jgi:hypothetical protein
MALDNTGSFLKFVNAVIRLASVPVLEDAVSIAVIKAAGILR